MPLTVQFRTCLGTLQFRFTEEEIQQLLRKYSLGAGLVGYTDFCRNIESVFEPGADEKAVIENSRSHAIFSEQEQSRLIEALQEIRFIILTNRIMLKPSFQDFDKARSSHITKDQFFRVLKKLNLFPEQPSMAELLARKYLDKGNLKEINYIYFCQDVDRPEDMFPDYSSKHPVPEPKPREAGVGPASTFYAGQTKDINVLAMRFQEPTLNIANDPNDVEERIKATVVMKRVRIEEFFRDFDKLRKGKVTAPQFKSILSQLNFQLTEEEYQSLVDKYRTQDGLFNHKDFCDYINTAFTRKGIDKNPEYRVAPVTEKET